MTKIISNGTGVKSYKRTVKKCRFCDHMTIGKASVIKMKAHVRDEHEKDENEYDELLIRFSKKYETEYDIDEQTRVLLLSFFKEKNRR